MACCLSREVYYSERRPIRVRHYLLERSSHLGHINFGTKISYASSPLFCQLQINWLFSWNSTIRFRNTIMFWFIYTDTAAFKTIVDQAWVVEPITEICYHTPWYVRTVLNTCTATTRWKRPGCKPAVRREEPALSESSITSLTRLIVIWKRWSLW